MGRGNSSWGESAFLGVCHRNQLCWAGQWVGAPASGDCGGWEGSSKPERWDGHNRDMEARQPAIPAVCDKKTRHLVRIRRYASRRERCFSVFPPFSSKVFQTGRWRGD